jgi:hypothetical protein
MKYSWSVTSLPFRANGGARLPHRISDEVIWSGVVGARRHECQDKSVTDQPSGDWPQTSTDLLLAGSRTTAEADDWSLLALERQFNVIYAELVAAQSAGGHPGGYHPARPPGRLRADTRVEAHSHYDEVATQQIESILARLSPIEGAIMQTPARTIAGLGVKARHAAYVMSQYWEAPIDRIDWDPRAVRLLIEAVCDFAHTPLPFQN